MLGLEIWNTHRGSVDCAEGEWLKLELGRQEEPGIPDHGIHLASCKEPSWVLSTGVTEISECLEKVRPRAGSSSRAVASV